MIYCWADKICSNQQHFTTISINQSIPQPQSFTVKSDTPKWKCHKGTQLRWLQITFTTFKGSWNSIYCKPQNKKKGSWHLRCNTRQSKFSHSHPIVFQCESVNWSKHTMLSRKYTDTSKGRALGGQRAISHLIKSALNPGWACADNTLWSKEVHWRENSQVWKKDSFVQAHTCLFRFASWFKFVRLCSVIIENVPFSSNSNCATQNCSLISALFTPGINISHGWSNYTGQPIRRASQTCFYLWHPPWHIAYINRSLGC